MHDGPVLLQLRLPNDGEEGGLSNALPRSPGSPSSGNGARRQCKSGRCASLGGTDDNTNAKVQKPLDSGHFRHVYHLHSATSSPIQASDPLPRLQAEVTREKATPLLLYLRTCDCSPGMPQQFEDDPGFSATQAAHPLFKATI